MYTGEVKSMIFLFSVPKIVLGGKDDIQVVYDATKLKLNGPVWPPNFYLLTVNSGLRLTYNSTWFGYVDAG